jgi:hypothetical protein
MKAEISCEQDAITWVSLNLPIYIRPSRKSKYQLVPPFRSQDAFHKVAEGLGKELWKLLNL